MVMKVNYGFGYIKTDVYIIIVKQVEGDTIPEQHDTVKICGVFTKSKDAVEQCKIISEKYPDAIIDVLQASDGDTREVKII
jgi:hypothetical protein